MIPDWQLPPGVDRGLWDYVSSERVAGEYDAALAGSALLAVDVRFAERHFAVPGRLIDLGCGTGRLLLHFAQRGYDCTGVDLSQPMLAEVRRKAEHERLRVDCLHGNLVELDLLADGSFDYAACLFSTLGMIRGPGQRERFLRHVRRIVKPNGIFVVHAHNARYRFGFGLGRRGAEPGDRTMPQIRGGADLTIHHYTRGELTGLLHRVGFRIIEIKSLAAGRSAELRAPWLVPGCRAHGFLMAAN